MAFCFIDSQKIDEDSRKRIRSHVMKGKNAGRIIKRGSHKLSRPTCTEKTATLADSSCAVVDTVVQGDLFGTVHRLIGHHYSGFSFPSGLSAENRQLVYRFFSVVTDAIYPLKFCEPVDLKRTIWRRSMTWDETFFHCTINVMAASCDFFFKKSNATPAALTHLSQAIQRVNQRISGAEALSDVTVVSVLTLAISAHLRGELDKWRVHLNGLYQLIELRGGLAEFYQCPDVLLKICRTDVEYALVTGSSTRFRPDEIPYVNSFSALDRESPPGNQTPSQLPTTFREIQPSLSELATDIFAMSDALNRPRDKSTSPHNYHECLILFSYRVLNVCPLNASYFDSMLDEASHLGLLIFISTLLFSPGRRPVLGRTVLAARLQCLFSESEFTLDPEFCIWLLSISYVASFRDTHDCWVLSTITSQLHRMGVRDWISFHRILYRYPWVNRVHDEPAHRLWDLVSRRICQLAEKRSGTGLLMLAE